MKSKPKTTLIIDLFSGFHDPDLTHGFIQDLQDLWQAKNATERRSLHFNICPIENISMPEGSAPGIGNHLRGHTDEEKGNETTSRVIIGFSAGVIKGAIAAKILSNRHAAPFLFIAIDGWGVPLFNGPYPIYRFSHDLFTHNSSSLLGGRGRFFADPPVSHLQMWKSPKQVKGWLLPNSSKCPSAAMEMNAAEALVQTLMNHC